MENYQAWEELVLSELKEMGYSEEEIEKAEVCENGQVHFHRNFFDITKPGFVTSYYFYNQRSKGD